MLWQCETCEVLGMTAIKFGIAAVVELGLILTLFLRGECRIAFWLAMLSAAAWAGCVVFLERELDGGW